LAYGVDATKIEASKSMEMSGRAVTASCSTGFFGVRAVDRDGHHSPVAFPQPS
jgi:hypothetical protein